MRFTEVVLNGFKHDQFLKQQRKLSELQMNISGGEAILQQTAVDLRTEGDNTVVIDSPNWHDFPNIGKHEYARRIRWGWKEGHYEATYWKTMNIILIANPQDVFVWFTDGRRWVNVENMPENKIRQAVVKTSMDPVPELTLEDKVYIARIHSNRVIGI